MASTWRVRFSTEQKSFGRGKVNNNNFSSADEKSRSLKTRINFVLGKKVVKNYFSLCSDKLLLEYCFCWEAFACSGHNFLMNLQRDFLRFLKAIPLQKNIDTKSLVNIISWEYWFNIRETSKLIKTFSTDNFGIHKIFKFNWLTQELYKAFFHVDKIGLLEHWFSAIQILLMVQ